MKTSDICPVCGGNTAIKTVKQVIRGGNHTATLEVKAEVCLRCGEKLYTPETVQKFEEIRLKLKNNQTQDFKPVGTAFQVV